MGWPKCDQSPEREQIQEHPIWHNVQFHHIGLILSALFGLISVAFSWYLIWRHATHYLKPWEQRHIIRILFMVPIYSIVSFLSYAYYRHAIYFEVIRDCYEAFAIASFFSLLCHYIAPDLHSQKDYFRGIQPKNWVMPINWFQRCCGSRQHGPWRVPRSGLTWFNILWLGIFQYCFVRVFMTLVAVITEAAGIYCLESLNPAFAHVWVMVIEGVCVGIAMYFIIQFYVQVKDDLAEHKPLLKVAAIKLVIFLSFWQTILISFLTSSGAVKASLTIQTPDIKIGIPAMLLCIEMALFSIFHLYAFPWKVYDIRRSHIVASESAPGFLPDPKTAYQGGFMGVRALMDAFNPWDLVKNVGRGFRWFAVGRRTRMNDISYKNTTNGSGLEPTRNQFTAFNETRVGGADFDGPSANAYAGAAVKGVPGRYHPLSEEGDDDGLLLKAQPNPTSRPYRSSTDQQTYHPSAPHVTHGDVGTAGNSDHPAGGPLTGAAESRLGPPYPTSPHMRTASMESQDTSYHGSRLTPDPHPLGPPGRKSYEQEEWEQYDGARGVRGESERDLGGGHGVPDNRF